MDIRPIRKATKEIAEDVNKLLCQLTGRPSVLSTVALNSLLHERDFVILGAFDGRERLVGIATVYAKNILTKRVAWIEDVVVDETHRGQGIGEALVRGLIASAYRMWAKEINLTSNTTREAANSLYQKLGFERRSTNVYRIRL